MFCFYSDLKVINMLATFGFFRFYFCLGLGSSYFVKKKAKKIKFSLRITILFLKTKKKRKQILNISFFKF